MEEMLKIMIFFKCRSSNVSAMVESQEKNKIKPKP